MFTASGIGMFAILIALFLLPLSFLPIFPKNDEIGAGGLRLIAMVLSLGGLLCILSAYEDFVVARYAYIIVGLSLIIASIGIALGLRPTRAKRKSKIKNTIP